LARSPFKTNNFMTPIAGVKTIADALSTIEAIAAPSQQPVPSVKEGASPTEKVAVENSIALITSQNAFAAREAEMIDALKTFAKARLAAVPTEIKVVGLDIRASIADGMELVSIRIIQHK